MPENDPKAVAIQRARDAFQALEEAVQCANMNEERVRAIVREEFDKTALRFLVVLGEELGKLRNHGS